jgi:hypothetical protein
MPGPRRRGILERMASLHRVAPCSLLALVLVVGCSGGSFEVASGPGDAGDGGALDTSAPDSSAPDSGAPDTGDAATAPDTRVPDATNPHDAADAADAADALTPVDASDGGGGGTTCVFGAPSTCGPDGYCDAPGCGTGVCRQRAKTETGVRNPVCGCDSVTYWNPSVAASHGMAVSSSGPCATPKPCGGFAGTNCPSGAQCNYRQADKNGCGIADASGTCWVIPASCPPVVIGSQSRPCNSNTCTDECNLIKDGTPWFLDTTCPM